ncbi:zinc metalloprotease [Thermocatellispora tengchongensis]|uniref:zinc metalloprotease n=1 Tax=Thermocatellispora tengchongensis TaxID=1073253 RepID=UPI003637657D
MRANGGGERTGAGVLAVAAAEGSAAAGDARTGGVPAVAGGRWPGWMAMGAARESCPPETAARLAGAARAPMRPDDRAEPGAPAHPEHPGHPEHPAHVGHASHAFHGGVRGLEPYAPGPAEVAKLIAEVREHERPEPREHRRERDEDRPARAPRTVGTWVHVITDGVNQVSRQSVLNQIATLNSAYGGRFGGADTGIRFRLDGTTTTRSPAWFADPLGNETEMKSRLRRGGPETLNLYIAQLNNLVLGYSTYPHAYNANPVLDGVVVDWRSLPGGTMSNFNKGYTAVHEIGHWLGLLHTFENGCAAPGDGVDDTPPEAKPTEGCPPAKDTCPGAAPTRSTTSWTTPTTPACASSQRARRGGWRRHGPLIGDEWDDLHLVSDSTIGT